MNPLLHGWPEDPTQAAIDRGKRLPRNLGSTIIDLQKQQATVFSDTDSVYSEITRSELSARYDGNVLTEGSRSVARGVEGVMMLPKKGLRGSGRSLGVKPKRYSGPRRDGLR